MKPFEKKPFPLHLLEQPELKRQHIFMFWFLYNHLEVDENNEIYITRKDFIKLYEKKGEYYNPSISMILGTLAEHKYIDYEPLLLNPTSTTFSHYRIRLIESAFDPDKEYIRKVPPSHTKEAYEKRRELAKLGKKPGLKAGRPKKTAQD